MKPEFDPDSPELKALDRTRTVPMSRAQRRAIAKRAGVRFSVVNEGMIKQPPLYLGIKQFKQAAHDPKLSAEYKTNAHLSLQELRDRRAAEQAAAVKVTEGKTLTKKQMKKLKK